MGKKNRKILNRILDLVEAVITNPATGIGKPEKLKYLQNRRERESQRAFSRWMNRDSATPVASTGGTPQRTGSF